MLTVNGQMFFPANDVQLWDPGNGSGSGLRLGYSLTSDLGYIVANDTGIAPKNLILQPDGGHVGIGTTNPQYPLQVNGTIAASEVTVMTGLSDYVFDPTVLKPFTIISGVRVHFLITDPGRVLPAAATRLEPAAHIGVVLPTHLYRPATINSRAAGVVDAVTTVPHNQVVKTWVVSNSLTFRDATGANAQSAAVSPSPGATDYTINLSVSR